MKVTVADNISVRKIGGELFIFDRKMSIIHSLNNVGTLIWEQLAAEAAPDKIAEKICDVFEVDQRTAHTDIIEYLRELESKKLITVDYE